MNTFSEPSPTVSLGQDTVNKRQQQVQMLIRAEEHRVRERYDQLLQDAYRQAPEELNEENRESWVLDHIESDINRLMEESREVLDPLQEELELLLLRSNSSDDDIPDQCGEEEVARDEIGEELDMEASDDDVAPKNVDASSPHLGGDAGDDDETFAAGHASSHLGEPSSTSKKDDELHPTPLLAGEDAITKWGSKTRLREQGGILVVQTISDIENLTRANLLSVGILEETITEQQITRIVELAWEYAEGKVQPMLPLTEEGRKAMLELVYRLVPHVFVKVAWTTKTEHGIFCGKTPSEMTDDELQILCGLLKR